jgi:hypothetical protein
VDSDLKHAGRFDLQTEAMKLSIRLKHFFREGQRTRVIDFPGDERAIGYVDFKYRNLSGGGRAKVQVWAK